MTHSELQDKLTELWRKHRHYNLEPGREDHSCFDMSESFEFMKDAMSLFDSYLTQEVERAGKAYGGCHRCYGKGYSTEAHAEIAFADFGDELGGASSRKTEGLRMNFCACDRGRQLEKLVPQQEKK